MLTFRHAVFALCTLFLVPRFVTELKAGSFYSAKGLGLVSDFISGRAVGMGGVGLAVSDAFTINYLNPATVATIPLTTLSGTFVHEATDLKSTTQDATISDSNVNGFQFVVPLKSTVAAISLGVNPYSTIEFAFSNSDSVAGTVVDQDLEGNGGVNTAFFTFSIKPFSRLYLGATGLFYFGKLRTVHRAIFPSGQLTNSLTETSQNVTAGGFRLGALLEITSGWNFGAVYAPALDLKTDKVVTLFQVAEFSDFVDQDIDIPLTIGVGTSVTFFNKLVVAVDYIRQNWKDVNGGSYLNNSQRMGVGIEYFPRGSRLDSYFSKAMYRAGFYYKDLGLEDPLGQKVTEFFGSVGMGLPVKWSAARIDVALEAGRRGSISNNPFRESVVRFTATVSVGERWFFRGGRR